MELQTAAKESRPPSLRRAVVKWIWRTNGKLILIGLLLESFRLAQPIFLEKIIEYFESYNPHDYVTYHEVLGYTAGLSLCCFISPMIFHLYFFLLQTHGWKLRVAMCHMIYRKVLCLSNLAMMKATTGKIVNLLSNDANTFDEVTIFWHYLFIIPTLVVAVTILLWVRIGPSSLAGLGVLLILMALQTYIGKFFTKYRDLITSLADSRIRTMNEVVSGMRIIKMYAWEKPFTALVSDIRRKEIAMTLKSSLLQGFNLATFFLTIKIMYFFTFTTYVLLGNPLTASHVFVTISIISCLQVPVTRFFPVCIQKTCEADVTIKRIQEFLTLDEIIKNCNAPRHKERSNTCVEVQNLVCYWDKNIGAPTLRNISFTLGSNQLLAVIGPVGAGKSSLLSAILGELPVEKGTLKVNSKMTYAAQLPWVFSGTIRSNILFGKEMNPEKYLRVLKACALKRDLELLPDGDLTLIGDRGVTLSGGQKARINLARAVYEDADIYLLDDPLSAVDAAVGRHLFEQCICGFLKEKARVLVTHQLQYLKAANEILVLKEGCMVTRGTYAELQESRVDFTSLLKKEDTEDQQHPRENDHKRSLSQSSVQSCSSSNSIKAEDQTETVPTLPEESRAQGNVPAGLYVKYLRAGNSTVLLITALIIYALTEVAYILQDWWLAYWSNQQAKLNVNSTVIENGQNTTAQLDTSFYLGIFAGLSAASILLFFVRTLLLLHLMLKSAEFLHNKMFNTVLRAPVRFFDTNPIGRVLNRFAKDIGQIDLYLPNHFLDVAQFLLHIFGVIVLTSVINPWIIIPLCVLGAFVFYLQHYYLQTSRDIKRLEAATRSPVFSHVSSSLNGLWTIRVFGAEERFQKMFDSFQDLHSEAWFLFLSTSRWCAVRLDLICSILVVLVSFGVLLLKDKLAAGSVGLVLSSIFPLVNVFQWAVKQTAELENMMISVERVVEYTQLESEAPWETEKHPPLDWPTKGMITFDKVNLAYSSDGPLVLKNLEVTFRPKEKVGIVGRTGAGKSSLISALFRLSEPQGNIYIDGVLTSEIGLHDLRQRMSIIPQDPVLFTGSVRKNLDPFDQHTDMELWNALEEVQLKSVVEELPAKMDTVLAESGSNFSVGQRQLVCLARAVLRKNRILIIDEATANVDPRTDTWIQRTIREKFSDCTVLTIAHRLHTIIDSDRILVLDAGRIQACDQPHILLQDPDGIFYQMVQQTGKQEAADLLQTAKQAYENGIQHKVPDEHKNNLVIFETHM